MRRAIETARAAGRKVAFTLSEVFVIDRHGDDFRALIDDGLIDILFANHLELAALTGPARFPRRIAALKDKVRRWSYPQRRRGGGASNGEYAEGRRPSRSSGWSTPPAPATSSPPASCSATFAAGRSPNACAWARSAPPK
jgi:sugar/nucleoside kinase (ribokinase family)